MGSPLLKVYEDDQPHYALASHSAHRSAAAGVVASNSINAVVASPSNGVDGKCEKD